MANTLRIKRRASGNAGAPSVLNNAELAFNEVDDTLYYGKGTGGAGGTATTVEAIGGSGAFVTLTSNQTNISGNKTFSGTVALGSSASATTPGTTDNSTKVATTAYVKAQNYLIAGDNIGAATATTPATADNDTSVATTAFVKAQGYLVANTAITAATKTKITYDADGLVTAGADLAASDIPSLTHTKISDFDTGVRTNRLDQMAAPIDVVSFNGQRITNVATPTQSTDAVNKAYADALVNGLDIKESCRVATTGNVSVTGGSGSLTIDGVTLANGDRILVKDQSTASENGIYYFDVYSSPTWRLSRATDADGNDEVSPGMFTFIEEGTVNADSGYVLTTNGNINVGSTSLTFTQFSGAGMVVAGNGLTKTGNTLAVGAGTGITVNANDVALTGQALALHNFTTNGAIVRTGANTFTVRSIAKSGNGLSVTSGDFLDGNPTISLTAALSTVGGLTPVANKLAYYTGASAASLTDLSAFGRSLIDDADAAAGRTTLGLGSMATQAHTNVNIDGGSIDGITFDGGTF